MGNITSGQGNNYLENGQQTPLNKFVEKVMNEEYFFTPNLSDDMISTKSDDDENKKVLLKRALCTGTTYVPISLPYVTFDEDRSRTEDGVYTININARGDAGNDRNGNSLNDPGEPDTKLPNIEAMSPQDYVIAEANAKRVLDNEVSEDELQRILNSQLPEDINTRKVLLYKQIVRNFGEGPDNQIKYNFTPSPKDAGNGARLGGELGCKLFYRGKDGPIDYGDSHQSTDYNSTDGTTGKSNTKAFCGKVFQYNKFAAELNGGLNTFGPNSDIIGRFTATSNRPGNGFRKDEFVDCACLNSILAVEESTIKKLSEEAILLAERRGEAPPNLSSVDEISPQSLAQNNDTYCKNNLSDFGEGAPGAYAMSNERSSKTINYCSSFLDISGVDQTGGNIDAGTDCGFNDGDLDEIKKCRDDPTAPGCSDILDESDPPDGDNNNTTTIVIVVVVLLLLAGAAYYFLVVKKKQLGAKITPTATIKYTKPTSDPLFRELK